jgi:general secretion pathway protein G
MRDQATGYRLQASVEDVNTQARPKPEAWRCDAYHTARRPHCSAWSLKPARRRTGSAGVTLIEVMIVVVILGLIAGGVAVAVLPKLGQAQKDTTRTSAMELRRAAESWRANHATDCPTPRKLQEDKSIDTASKITDAWDSEFKIICEEDETIVVSYGPDKKEGTADDIRVPELKKQ